MGAGHVRGSCEQGGHVGGHVIGRARHQGTRGGRVEGLVQGSREGGITWGTWGGGHVFGVMCLGGTRQRECSEGGHVRGEVT